MVLSNSPMAKLQRGNLVQLCGSLNIIGAHKLIKRYSFVGVSMSLLEEGYHCRDEL